MAKFLDKELDLLGQMVYKMADICLEVVDNAVDSLKNSDLEMAEIVKKRDEELDQLEINIDNECIKAIVTRQPAATDLRFVLSVLKINTDLERIGDLAVNIANETIKLNGKPTLKPLVDLPRMSSIAMEMLQLCFEAFSSKNSELAKEIIKMDDKIDQLNFLVNRELFDLMHDNKDIIDEAMGLILVSKALERIGDHATNIAEKVIYYVDGVDVRHS